MGVGIAQSGQIRHVGKAGQLSRILKVPAQSIAMDIRTSRRKGKEKRKLSA